MTATETIPPSTVIPPGTPMPGQTAAPEPPAPSAQPPASPASPAATPTAQPKSTETPPAEGEAKSSQPEPGSKQEGAPDRYELTVPKGMPEGFQIDSEVQGAIEKAARDLNLSNGSAQKLLDEVWPVMHARAVAEQTAIVDGWKRAVQADSEIGGSRHGDTLTNVALARDKFATPKLLELLKPALGEHPEIVRFFSRIGALLKQDSRLVTSGNAPAARDYGDRDQAAAVMFSNTPVL